MQFAYASAAGIEKFLSSWFQSDPSLRLSSDEKACYERIVKDLLQACKSRANHPRLIPNNEGQKRTYAIIFRQSESWRKVEEMFNEIETILPNNIVADWTKSWKTRINKMRGLYYAISDYSKQLQNIKQNIETSQSSSDIEYCKVRGELISRDIATKQNELYKELQEGKQNLENLENLENLKSITKYDQCNKVINFINANWPCLTVFADWHEVSIDVANLNVQTRVSKVSAKEYAKHLNCSTKAIFEIEELIEEKPFKYNGLEPGTIYIPKGVNLKNSCYADSPKPRKRSSSVKLTDSLFFDNLYLDENPQEKNITSLATKLQDIVEFALREVNKKLPDINKF